MKPTWENKEYGVRLYRGDCLEVMPTIADGEVDLVLTDPPYGTTACKWDSVIPLGEMWENLKRLTKDNAAYVFTAAQPFTTKLISSNLKWFKYSLVWVKTRVSHFAQAPYRFLTIHEDITVFSKAGCAENSGNIMTYNPQGVQPCNIKCRGKGASPHRPVLKVQPEYIQENTNYPKSIINFQSVDRPKHPTQKPVALMEYMIKTYTRPGELVLDFTMGSGTTGVAAVKNGRHFIGIEMDAAYFDITVERIAGAIQCWTGERLTETKPQDGQQELF